MIQPKNSHDRHASGLATETKSALLALWNLTTNGSSERVTLNGKAHVMKNRYIPAVVAAIAMLPLLIHASEPVATLDAASPSAPATIPAPAQLTYGVEDILKLVRAKVADDVTATFIQNSGRRFNLEATEILYLRQEGVSDRVLATMLSQQSRLAGSAPTPPATAATPIASAPQYVAGSTPPPTVYQAAPASTVYVVRDSAPSYYSSYPYSYWGYSYPSLSFNFGFGSGYYGGYYGNYYGGSRACYNGGYYYNGSHNNGYYHGGSYRGGGSPASVARPSMPASGGAARSGGGRSR